MYIKEIELYNFRNYREEKVSFSENVNIFLGSNAQGKTNMLEGIYLNSIGKSFKNVRDKELVRFGEEFCRVKTVFESSGVLLRIRQNGPGTRPAGIRRVAVPPGVCFLACLKLRSSNRSWCAPFGVS